MKQELFAGFIMELAELLRYNDDPYVLLCDSVSSHLNAPNFGDQGQLKYLPKYSPFLNACEMAGSCLKAAVKRQMTEPAVQQEIYNREAPRNETLHNRRMRIVSREIKNGLPTITVQKCAQYLNHVMGYEGIFIATVISNIVLGIAGWLWFKVRLVDMSKKA